MQQISLKDIQNFHTSTTLEFCETDEAYETTYETLDRCLIEIHIWLSLSFISSAGVYKEK